MPMNKIEKLIKELCPNGVEWKNVKDVILSLKTGLNPRDNFKLNEENADCFYITGKEIYNNRINISEKTDLILREVVQLINKRAQLHSNVLLFASTGTGTVGRMAIVKDYKEDWNVSETLYIITTQENIISIEYLMYILYSDLSISQYAPKISKGSVPHLKVVDLLNVSIPVPPLPIQTEIVRILDKFVEQQEQLERLIELRKKQYEYYREEMLKPKEGWMSSKISDFTNVFTGSRVHKDEWKTTGVPFYRSSDVVSYYNGMENNHGKVFISNDLYNKLSAKSGKFHKDDILITGGGTIGIPYLVPNDEPLYVKDADLLCIQKNNSVHHKFLYYFFLTKRFRIYLNLITHNATIAHYTISQIRDTIVDYPSYSEQEEIVSIISDIETSLLALKSALELSKKRYEYYRDKMLKF